MEIKQGVLVPLQKPGKKKGPADNLRPIILLSILRKILAICVIKRIGDKIDAHIPPTQSAYRSGRSTTEQVFTIKIMAEKAITSANYKSMLLLMDMSKAFDTIHRALVIEDLRSILQPDELHIIKVMIEDVELKVRVGTEIGESFKTNIGTPQGDCISPILFTLYLANALKEEHNWRSIPELHDHTYQTTRSVTTPNHLHDHNYSIKRQYGTLIDLQYADDICWIGGNCAQAIDYYKNTIPGKLEIRNLSINTSKTEEYEISRENDKWKKCKYLGSLLDTEEDINRRKQITRATYKKVQPALEDKYLPLHIKMEIFRTVVSSVFLYNSEVWTVTNNMQEKLDTFQRNLLRQTLKIRYPRKISNEELYDKTKESSWAEKVKKRRLKFFGHMARLPEKAPAKKAIDEFLNTKTKKVRGGQKLTWVALVNRDLKQSNVTVEQAMTIAQDRGEWRAVVERSR